MGLGLTLFLLAVLLALLFWVATPRKPRKITPDSTRSSSGESGYFLAYGSSAYESTSSKLTKTPDRSDSE
ncbi:hypothetical protein [Allomeiothermus silvanus]|uniref:hypothetical protein n=1 Tax=Allomeiothermus silvanus TaxID=52022 RepID=UPI0023F171D1|nr:hypothetical protein [Allomeiothermus silvanus]